MIRSPAGFDGGDRIKRYLDYYQPSYGVMMLSAGQFSPAQLFANGEIGAWYDPSDFSTMFTDSTGTTPVTAVGQAVGLILDKSQGLAIGSEIVTNGDFSNGTTGWAGNGSYAVSGGALAFTNGAYGEIYQTPGAAITNKYIKVSFNLTITSGTVTFRPNYFSTAGQQAFTTSGLKEFYVYGDGTRFSFITSAAPSGASIDNVSIKAVAGNHASQSTSTSRPTLSARVNLLTYSEQFDNAAWNKAALNTTGTPAWVNVQTAPDGTTTADKMIENTAAAQHYISRTATVVSGFAYTLSVYLKAGERTWTFLEFYGGIPAGTVYVNLSTGAKGTTTGSASAVTVTDSGNGWWRVVLPGFVASSTSAAVAIYTSTGNGVNSYTGDGTSGIFIWGADLRSSTESTSLPTYQRIAAATDYDTTGFPYYLSFDGTDDFLVTGTINPGSVDKAQVFAGVRKLSDAATGVVCELSSTINNAGTFSVYAPYTGASYASLLNGSALGGISYTTFTSPLTNVVSSQYDISQSVIASEITFRANATTVAGSSFGAANAGTGNFGTTYPLYIGRRGGTTLPFNGNIYSLIVRFGPNLDTTTISNTETWVNGKTLAY